MKLRRLALPIVATLLGLLIVNIGNTVYDRTINTQLAVDQMKKDTPSYITLRELENQKIAFDRWTGILPTTVFGGSQGIPGMFLNMPMPTNKP